jgi:hypothetical protein
MRIASVRQAPRWNQPLVGTVVELDSLIKHTNLLHRRAALGDNEIITGAL